MILRILAIVIAIFPALGQKCYLEHQGKKRNYTVHVPLGYLAGRAYPLVMSFHGGGGDPNQQQHYTSMNEVADKEGFIVVYPDSYRFWNAGLFPWDGNGNDDVGFVRLLLDSLIVKFSIHKDSIYAAGLSMGGFFTHRLGCELNNRIAAFAAVSGPISHYTRKHCEASGKVPFLYIHGTLDPLIRYLGSKEFSGAKGTVEFWREFNHCKTSDTLLLPDNYPKDRTTSTLIRFRCQEDAQVWFVKVKGGGHTWPGGKINYWYFGNTSLDFNASQLAWDFFKQFSLKKQTL